MPKRLSTRLQRHYAFIVSVLLAYLIKEFALFLLKKATHQFHDDVFLETLIGMGLVIIVFYPVYEGLKHLAGKFLDEYFKHSGKMAGSRLTGITLGFLILLGILYCVYLYLWHHVNIFTLV